MALAVARYVQTGGQRSNATNWATGANQAWFNAARKTSALITHNTSGTPTVSSFTLLAPGSWNVAIGLKAAGAIGVRIDIALGAYAYANSISSCSGPAVSGNNSASCTVTFQANANDVVYVVWALTGASALDTTNGDCNYISLAYLGAV